MDTQPKTHPGRDTRELVKQWRAHDPYATISDMASGLGVSRERVRQILVESGLPTVPPPRKPPPFILPKQNS